MGYKLKLEIFEGPLDLLLYLIKKEEINIYDIPIAEVTAQYMGYIEMLKVLDLDIVGDFLVMAAELIKIKSRMLLPPDPTEKTPEEDPRNDLVQRLLEYKKFKEIADELGTKESERQMLFSRKIDTERLNQLKEESREVYFEASLFELINALMKAINRVPADVFHEIIKDEYTIEQKVHEILHLLLDCEQVNLQDLFNKSQSKIEVIVTFLAILELIRLKEVLVVQKMAFEEIIILRNKENICASEPRTGS